MAGTKEGLGNKIWNNAELQAFATSQNTKNYQDYKRQLESDYDKNYSAGGNFLNWLGTGLSGGGWTKEDYLKNRGLDDEVNAYGNAGYFGTSDMNSLRDYGSQYNKAKIAQLESGKNLFSGIPIVGDLFSAPAQTLSAVKDLAETGTKKWETGKRDWLSDLGAGASTALDIATLGLGSKMKAGAQTLGGAVKQGAKLGAAYGLTGGLNEMGAQNFNLGQLLTGTALGAGLGGGVSALGYGLGKIKNNKAVNQAVEGNADVQRAANALNEAKSNLTSYQDALNAAKGYGLDTTSSDTLHKTYRTAMSANHPDKVGNAVAALPASTTATTPVANPQLFSNEKVAKAVQSGSTPTASYMQALNEAAKSEATRKTKAIKDVYNTLKGNLNAEDLLKAEIMDATNAYNTILNRATNEAVKANIGKYPGMVANKVLGSKGSKTLSGLLKTKKGKVAAGVGGGLLLAQLLGNRGSNQNADQMTDEEIYNYVYGGQQ